MEVAIFTFLSIGCIAGILFGVIYFSVKMAIKHAHIEMAKKPGLYGKR